MNFIKRTSLFLMLTLLGFACQEKKSRPATALDTARLFVESSLKGDIETAALLLDNNSANKEFYKTYENYYQKLSAIEKQQYKKANYQINSYNEINDTTCLINYTNDYMRTPMDIKLVKKSGEWFVDFSYTYNSTSTGK